MNLKCECFLGQVRWSHLLTMWTNKAHNQHVVLRPALNHGEVTFDLWLTANNPHRSAPLWAKRCRSLLTGCEVVPQVPTTAQTLTSLCWSRYFCNRRSRINEKFGASPRILIICPLSGFLRWRQPRGTLRTSGSLSVGDRSAGGVSRALGVTPAPPATAAVRASKKTPLWWGDSCKLSMTECFPSVPGRVRRQGNVLVITEPVFSTKWVFIFTFLLFFWEARI